jgi:SM-20-related protein
MLNDTIKWSEYKALYERDGLVRVPNVLKPEVAEDVYAALSGGLEWELVCSGLSEAEDVAISEAQYSLLDGARKAQISKNLLIGARTGYAFYYYRHELYKTGNLVLQRIFRELAAYAFVDVIKFVTGEQGIRQRSGMATSYRPGCFLRTHNDEGGGQERKVAYVLGFTREWQEDWGGALNFTDQSARTAQVLVPGFNELSMFRVPRDHFVSQVANYAKGQRLAVTGWFMV